MIRIQNELWLCVKRIYIAANLPDAHITLNLVVRAGIRAEVMNINV